MWVNLTEVSTDPLSIIPEDVLFSKKSTIKIYLFESNALNDKSKVYFLPTMPFYNGRTIRTQEISSSLNKISKLDTGHNSSTEHLLSYGSIATFTFFFQISA